MRQKNDAAKQIKRERERDKETKSSFDFTCSVAACFLHFISRFQFMNVARGKKIERSLNSNHNKAILCMCVIVAVRNPQNKQTVFLAHALTRFTVFISDLLAILFEHFLETFISSSIAMCHTLCFVLLFFLHTKQSNSFTRPMNVFKWCNIATRNRLVVTWTKRKAKQKKKKIYTEIPNRCVYL